MIKIQISNHSYLSMDSMKKFKEIIVYEKDENNPKLINMVHYYIENPNTIYVLSHKKKQLLEGVDLNRLRGGLRLSLEAGEPIYAVYRDDVVNNQELNGNQITVPQCKKPFAELEYAYRRML